MTSVESPVERFSALPPDERQALIEKEAQARGVTPAVFMAQMARTWEFLARPKQLPPDGDWTYWFLMSGRGFGKTISGAQWTKKVGVAARCRIGFVAPTAGDVRRTMFEGETGILSILQPHQLMGGSRATAFNRSTLELTLANGTKIEGFSSEEPNRLRGPAHHYLWCEEVSSWKDAHKPLDELDTTWSNASIGCRLGRNPRAVLTSTPKANKLTKELIALQTQGDLVLVTGSSYENRANLAEAYWRTVISPLEGKRAGRQEIHAEVLDDVEGALWKRSDIDRLRIPMADVPPLARIVVGVDPNVSSKQSADSAGIIVAGVEQRPDWPHAYILDDLTVVNGGPRAWSAAAVEAYHEWNADRIVAEVNNGGELVEMAIKSIDPNVSYKELHASRGKRIRAEPVSALYEGDPDDGDRAHQPRVHHAGVAAKFADLEDEMTTWTPADDSPNRMDALVWTLTELVLDSSRAQIAMRTTVPGKDRSGAEVNIAPDRFGVGI